MSVSEPSFHTVLECVAQSDDSVGAAQVLFMQLTLPVDIHRQAHIINNGLSFLQNSRMGIAASMHGLRNLREVVRKGVESQAGRLSELEASQKRVTAEEVRAMHHETVSAYESQVNEAKAATDRAVFERDQLSREMEKVRAEKHRLEDDLLMAKVELAQITLEKDQIQQEADRVFRELRERVSQVKENAQDDVPSANHHLEEQLGVERETQTDVSFYGQRTLRSSKRGLV